MPITPNRSSREWSASALERDREAKAQAAEQQRLQAQIAALRAQIEVTEASQKRIEEQAAIERQNAKNSQFYEIGLAQQEMFRGMLADDTYTRVAQTFTKVEDFKYVAGIGEGRPGYDSTTELKAMLWDAVAGNDPTFLQQAAQKIAHRQRHITDEDILAIQKSVSCFGANFVSLTQPQVIGTCGGNIEQDTTLEDPRGLVGAIQSNIQTSESVIPLQVPDISGGLLSSTTSLTDVAQADTKQDASTVKLEAIEPGPHKRNLMDVIEQDTMSAVRSDSVADSDINIELTDPLGNIITDDGSEARANTSAIRQPPTQDAEPETPTSTSHKRQLEDDGTPTPSEIDGTNTSKKRKTTRSKSTAKTPTKKFQEYVEARFKSGDLDSYDLVCSVCSQEAKTPRVATRCHHVYCNTCFNTRKGTTKSRDVICAHRDCDSAVGIMSPVAEDVIKNLRATFIAEDDDQGVYGNIEAETNQDDEMTDEE